MSSKLKALKFMQRRQSPSEVSNESQAALEQNRAKLAANVRWTIETEVSTAAPAPARNYKVVYEASGGQNRTSHNVYNDFKKKEESEDEKPDEKNKSDDSVKAPKVTSKSSPPPRNKLASPERKAPSHPPESAALFDIIRKKPAQAKKEKDEKDYDYFSGGNRRRN